MNRVFTGTGWRALTKTLSGEIQKARIAEDLKQVVVIVPSQASRYWIYKQLAELFENDLVGIGVFSMYQFALDVFSRLGILPPEVIEDKRYISLIWQLLNEDLGGLGFSSRNPYPTVHALYSLLRELRDAAVCEEEASWLAESEPYEGMAFLETSKAKKVFAFYKRYASSLKKRKWVDTPELFRSATQVLASQPNFKISNPVFVWGFCDFVGVQRDFLRELSQHTEINCFIPSAQFTQPFIHELVGWKTQSQEIPDEAFPAKTTVFSAPAPKEEAWAIVHKILDIKRRDVRWEDFCVIYRKPEDFLLLKRTFLEFGVPCVCFEDVEASLSQKPLGQTIICALKFLRKPSPKNFLDIVLSQANIVGSERKKLLISALARLLSIGKEKLFSLLKSDFVIEAIKLGSQIQKDKASLFAKEAHFFVRLYQKGLSLATSLNAQSLIWWLDSILAKPEDSNIKKAYDNFKELLRNLPQEAFACRPFLISLLYELLESVLLESAYSTKNSAGVWLVSANQARGAFFPYVFIFGTNDGAYPLSFSEDPFLSSGIRERLHQLGIHLSRPDVSLQEEALLFELLGAGAAHELFISYSQMGAGGRPLLASPFVKKEPDHELVGNFREEKTRFLQSFCPALTSDFSSEMTGLPTLCRRENQGGSFVSNWPLEQWKKWLQNGDRFSPTLVADYLSCAQAFFWGKVLGLSGLLPEPRHEFYPASWLGEIFSEVLVEFLRKDGSDSALSDFWEAHLESRFPQIATHDLAPSERYKMRRIRFVFEKLEKDLKTLKGTKGFRDIHPEKDIKLSLCDFPFRLKARVDAYSYPDYLEFKLTSRSVFGGIRGTRLKPAQMLKKLLDPSLVEGGRYGWQILFYLAFSLSSGDSASVFLINPHWEVSSQEASPRLYSWSPNDEMKPLMEKLKKAVSLIAQGISLADDDCVYFPFWPHEERGKRCGFCPYQILCLKDVSWIRLANEKLISPLLEFHDAS